jgi:hypothetical protein
LPQICVEMFLAWPDARLRYKKLMMGRALRRYKLISHKVQYACPGKVMQADRQ